MGRPCGWCDVKTKFSHKFSKSRLVQTSVPKLYIVKEANILKRKKKKKLTFASSVQYIPLGKFHGTQVIMSKSTFYHVGIQTHCRTHWSVFLFCTELKLSTKYWATYLKQVVFGLIRCYRAIPKRVISSLFSKTSGDNHKPTIID